MLLCNANDHGLKEEQCFYCGMVSGFGQHLNLPALSRIGSHGCNIKVEFFTHNLIDFATIVIPYQPYSKCMNSFMFKKISTHYMTIKHLKISIRCCISLCNFKRKFRGCRHE